MPDPAAAPSPGTGLVTVTASGRHFTVNSRYADNFAGAVNDLAAAGYPINDVQGYNNRNIRGTHRPSQHSFGEAIDINPVQNPQGAQGDIPPDLARRVAAAHGLGWGGDFTGRTPRDPMHFEVPAGGLRPTADSGEPQAPSIQEIMAADSAASPGGAGAAPAAQPAANSTDPADPTPPSVGEIMTADNAPAPAAPQATGTLSAGINAATRTDVRTLSAPRQDGSFTDAAGNVYRAAPEAGDNYYRDAGGNLFQDIRSAQAAPTAPAPVTAGGVVGQGARGVLEGGMATAGSAINAAAPNAFGVLNQAADSTDYIASLMRAASSDAPPPGSGPSLAPNPAIGALGDIGKLPVATPQPVSDWLAQQPGNAFERTARTLGQYAPGLAFGPEGEAGMLSQVLSRAANVAVPAAMSLAARGTAHAFGASPELEDMAANAGGLAGGLSLAAPAAFGPGLARVAAPIRNAFDPVLASVSKPAAQAAADTAIRTGQIPAAALDTAQRTALANVHTGGDPMALTQALTSHLDGIDATTQARVDAARQSATQAAGGIGGTGTPQDTGAALRTSLLQAQADREAQVNALYKAAGLNDVTANLQATKQAATTIPGQMLATSAPMEAAEAHAFQVAAQMPDVAPLKMLTELRSQVGSLVSATRGPAHGRLSQLYAAIQDNLSNSVADKVESDQAQVAAGQMAPEQTLEAQYRALQAKWGVGAQARVGVGGAQGGGGNATSGTVAVPGVPGAGGASVGQPGNASGPQGLPSPDQPTITPEHVGQLNTAAAGYRDLKNDFGAKPVANAVATQGGPSTVYSTPDGKVPSLYFQPGPAAADNIAALLKVNPTAAPMLSDYAAQTLRTERVMDADGVVDPKKFAAWRAKYANALSALPPDAQARFADVGSAGQAVADAQAAREAAMSAYNQGVTAHLLGVQDPDGVSKVVGGVFNRPTSTQDMRSLVQAASSDPDAAAGLRQSVTDYISRQFASGQTVNTKGIAAFVAKNRDALGEVLTPDQLSTLDSIGAARTPKPNGGGMLTFLTHRAFGLLGAGVGFWKGGLPGAAEGLVGGGTLGEVVNRATEAGTSRINQIINQAMQDPVVAKAALAPVPANARPDSAVIRRASANLARALLRSTAAPALVAAGQPPTPAPSAPQVTRVTANAYAPGP